MTTKNMDNFSHDKVILNHSDLAASKWDSYIASDVADHIGSFHFCLVLNALRKTGLAKTMRDRKEFSLDEISGSFRKDLLNRLMGYMSIKGVARDLGDQRFVLTERGMRSLDDTSLAQIEFYVESYSPVTAKIGELLSNDLEYGKDISRNGAALGSSCDTLFSIYHTPIIHKIVKDHNIKKIVDLGCGGGQLLMDVCKEFENVQGVGIDLSNGAIDLASTRASQAGLTGRLSFHVGDAFKFDSWPKVALDADMLCAVGAIHEHFRSGEQAVVDILNLYADFVSSNGSRIFILGEPELYYDDEENDSDLNLVHIFTAQGFPRERQNWIPVIEKSKFKIESIYTRRGIGPRFNFYKLVVNNH